jgi:predicted DNA-binding transcriptional regulator AlpA
MSTTDLQAVPAADGAAIPDEARAVALVSKRVCCAMGDVGQSWWDERVASGEAPQPVIQAPRFTRWRLADVIAFWRDLAERGDPEGAEKLTRHARKASALAQAARAQRKGAAR